MATQRSRADVQPLTWEIPAAGAACWLLAALMVFPAGQGAAGWLFAGGFVWPRGPVPLLQSVGGLLTGRPGRGLRAGAAAHLSSTPSVYVLIGFGELALFAVTAWVVVAWWRHLGPGARRGMAGRAEMQSVLGISNLRRKGTVIRPDLHTRQARTPRRSQG